MRTGWGGRHGSTPHPDATFGGVVPPREGEG